MTSGAEAIKSTSPLPELPLPVYCLIAQALPQEDLPSLRLVSKDCYQAANKAVRTFGQNGCVTNVQLDFLDSCTHKFPSLSKLDLSFIPGNMAKCLEPLRSVTTLQHITMYYTLAESTAGWTVLQQQAHLTSFCAVSLEYDAEAGMQDWFLHNIADLTALVKLDLPLSSLATDKGVRSLARLTNLQSLALQVSKWEARVSASSMTVFTDLCQLTSLSLEGWPVRDSDLIRMTSLINLRHIDLSQCERLSTLCFMPLLQFSHLQTLNIVRGDEWVSDYVVDMFCSLRPAVKLKL